MNILNYIGIVMIGMFFLGIFFVIAHMGGFGEAVQTFIVGILMVAFILTAVYLTTL